MPTGMDGVIDPFIAQRHTRYTGAATIAENERLGNCYATWTPKPSALLSQWSRSTIAYQTTTFIPTMLRANNRGGPRVPDRCPPE